MIKINVTHKNKSKDKNNKKYKKSLLILLVLILAVMSAGIMGNTAYADDSAASVVQTYVNKASNGNTYVTWYVQGIKGKIQSTETYVGKKATSVTECGTLGSEHSPEIKTLILIDNSSSMNHNKNKEKMIGIVTRLVWNHKYSEYFSIKTISETAEPLVEYTTNYDKVRVAIEGMTFNKQNTYLRNVVYDEIKNNLKDKINDYSRIILIGDGSDDSKKGVTYEELFDLVTSEEGRCPIYTIGSYFEKSQDSIDKMYALSRINNMPYYDLDNYETPEDALAIADEILADTDSICYFTFAIPSEDLDGTQKNIVMNIVTSEGEYMVQYVMQMPGTSLDDLRQYNESDGIVSEDAIGVEDTASSDGIITEDGYNEKMDPDDETDTTDTNDTGNNQYTVFGNSMIDICVVLVAVVILGTGIYHLIMYGKKKPDKELHPDIKGAVTAKDNSGTSRAMSEKIVVTLINVNNPTDTWKIDSTKETVIGRSSSRSDIAFSDDKSMASRHAQIHFVDGMAYIQSATNSLEIYVGDKLISGETELRDSDIIKIGDTSLKVKYE